MSSSRIFSVAVIVVLTIIAINVLFLNYSVFLKPKTQVAPNLPVSPSPTITRPSLITSPTPTNTIATTSADCLACHQELAIEVKRLESLMDQKVASLAATNKSQIKEFYVPLGSGTTTSEAWKDVGSTEITFDTANYPPISETYFETALYIPTKNGTVQARLLNVTDNIAVSGSELSTASDTSTKLSAKITLPQGKKTYRVQMLSTLKYEAKMDYARLRILVQ